MGLAFPKKGKKKVKITTEDRWFSKFIRIRDIEYGEYCICCTCGKPIHWKYEAECGHFVTRDRQATRFHEQNCHAQCYTCNCEKHGEQFKHGQFIDEKYGLGTSKMLMDIGNIRGAKRSELGLKDIGKEYRLKTKKIAQKKGVELK